jgi:hypothetical protein
MCDLEACRKLLKTSDEKINDLKHQASKLYEANNKWLMKDIERRTEVKKAWSYVSLFVTTTVLSLIYIINQLYY